MTTPCAIDDNVESLAFTLAIESSLLKLALISASVLLAVVLSAVWAWTPDKTRAALESKYLDAPGDMISVANARLHVRASGQIDAPPLILIHGFGSSLHTWEAWARELARDYRVIRFDLPGSGLSPPDPTGLYVDARIHELLIALMDQLGVVRASIVGHSIGGRIAWTFAALHAERVAKLVLISPDGFASPGFEYGRPTQVPTAVKLMRHALPKALLRMSLAPAYADPATLTPELVTRYHDLMLAPGARDALIARLEQTTLTDPVPLLQRIRAPILLLWGEQDQLIPFTNAQDYGRAVPAIKLVPFARVGHLPQEEIPAQSVEAVRAFLGEI